MVAMRKKGMSEKGRRKGEELAPVLGEGRGQLQGWVRRKERMEGRKRRVSMLRD